jgi:hypothetical protein
MSLIAFLGGMDNKYLVEWAIVVHGMYESPQVILL